MNDRTGQREHGDDSHALSISRRKVLKAGGLMLVGTTLFGGGLTEVLAQQMRPGVTSAGGGSKPTYLPEAGSKDPVAHSVAENLFWNEQLMEHTAFFIMLMPGPELAKQRAEAQKLQAMFSTQLKQAGSKKLDRSNYAAFNKSTIEHVKHIVDFKHRMRDAQVAGKLKSLVWPTFFEHTASEADYFAARLAQLSRGDVAVDSQKAVAFWTTIMGDHADFVGHLLDPTERELVAKALNTGTAFRKLHAQPTAREAAMRAVDDIIDFKVAAEKGINAGKIKSIIHPTLADHVRREALKAADELKRAV